MSESKSKSLLKVSVFSDYICPFCYIGSERLLRLKSTYDLRVNWCLVQIHPETPAAGMPVENLNYSSEKWQSMMRSLDEMAQAEGIHLAERTITTNSYKALLLAEASKSCGRDIFYRLHHGLFRAFFSEGRNIGDPEVLQKIAIESGLEDGFAESAWQNPDIAQKLNLYQEMSGRYQISGVPTYFFGKQKIFGASTLGALQEAAEDLLETRRRALSTD